MHKGRGLGQSCDGGAGAGRGARGGGVAAVMYINLGNNCKHFNVVNYFKNYHEI